MLGLSLREDHPIIIKDLKTQKIILRIEKHPEHTNKLILHEQSSGEPIIEIDIQSNRRFGFNASERFNIYRER